jgi:hypothetical protein
VLEPSARDHLVACHLADFSPAAGEGTTDGTSGDLAEAR